MNDRQNEPKLTYALDKSGKMVYVDDVDNGIECNCLCPECKGKLVAKNKGKIKEHHFAHSNGMDCPGAQMTALHMLAQQIIEEEKQVMLPDYQGEYVNKKTEDRVFDRVSLEETIKTRDGEIRPDCVGYICGKDKKEYRLLIEIFVTHEVDENKSKAIQSSNEYCIEIDLSDLIKTDYTRELIAKRLKEQKNDRKWLNCPVYDEQEKEELDKAEQIRLEQELEEYEQRRKEESRRKKLQEQVMIWYSGTNPDIAAFIQSDLSKCPFIINNNSNSKAPNPLFEDLVPQNDFLYFIDKSPKNDTSLELFYTLLHFYYIQTRTINFGELENRLREFRNRRDILSKEERIQLEELISLRIIYILVRQREKLYSKDKDKVYDNVIKRYTYEPNLRKEILMASSIIYHHIVASSALDFDELTKEIMSYHPMLAKSFSYMINNQQKYLKYLFHETTLEELRDFVKNRQWGEEEDVDKYLKECYSYAFDGKIKYKEYYDTHTSYAPQMIYVRSLGDRRHLGNKNKTI